MSEKLPVSVIVVTKNEEPRIRRCLAALADFDDVWVVDSESEDKTQEIAAEMGVNVVNFIWNGKYPKKRQYCLNQLELAYSWVFFVDADEVVTPELVEEIHRLDFKAAGYYVRGRYVFGDRVLQYGLHNNKLALFDRRCVEFPVVDDLGLPGMGEIEGHYQPVLKEGHSHEHIGQLKSPLLHYAYEYMEGWEERHQRYAAWESGMNRRHSWPGDKRLSKRIFKSLPFQGLFAFAHSYFLKLGLLDGIAGLRFACSRWRYYRMID